jgi:hypothetical protein
MRAGRKMTYAFAQDGLRAVLTAGIIYSAFATSLAQTGTLAGRVIDAATLEPLPFANVFINNTTIGTATDVSGNFTLSVPAGSQEVVFSFIGYSSFQARYQISENETTPVNVRLSSFGQVLGEVAISTSRDKTWEKQLRKFEKVFFGEDDFGRRCRINNPWVIDFHTEGSKITATATSPVDITNEALGYRLTFHLKDFITDGSTFSIVGNARYEEMEASTADVAFTWMRNRETAYNRSARHFFKALIDQKLVEEGFRLYRDAGPGTPARSNNFNTELIKNVKPYEPVAIVAPGATIYELKVQLKDKVEVHYLNEATRTYFYKDVGHNVSWLETKGGSVRVTPDGVLLNPRELVLSGDMSAGRVSEMLPLDFKPGAVVRVKAAPGRFLAQRYEEKAYVHVSKPYFYPGETIWFKAYMSYRDQTKKDTLSNVLYVDLLDQNQSVIQTRTLRLDSLRYGEFRLPAQMSAGLYSIRAYSNWMLNYGSQAVFTLPLPVLDPYERLKGPDLSAHKVDNTTELLLPKHTYGVRERVDVTVSLSDDDVKPLAGDFSLAVIDIQQVKSVPWSRAIPEAREFGDITLPSAAFSHRVEKGFTFNGQFFSSKGKTAREDLTLILNNFEGIFTTSTDDRGVFAIHDLPFYDSVSFAVQGRNKKGNPYGSVSLLQRAMPISNLRAGEYKYEVERQTSVQRVVPPYEKSSDVIMLKEVSVSATRIEHDKPVFNTYGQADKVFNNETLVRRGGSLATALQSIMPGYTLAFLTDHWYFIRDRNLASSGRQFREQDPEKISRTAPVQAAPAEPVLIINNALFVPGTAETVGDRLQGINPANVERVEVNSPMGSLTGSLGAAGVINVYMKTGTTEHKSESSYQVLKVPGFSVPSEFVAPDYSITTSDEIVPDVRSTIYWNPSINVNGGTGAKLSFYTADIPGAYLLILEGLLSDGTPVHTETTVEVR